VLPDGATGGATVTAHALPDALRDPPLLGLLAAGLAFLSVLVLLGRAGDGSTRTTDDAVAHEGVRSIPDAGSGAATRGRSNDGGAEGDGRRASEAEVSSALALLALAYRSGLPTWDVLEAVAAGVTGRASTDLCQVAAALRWGATEADAWASVGPIWGPAARAVAIAHQAGVPPGAMLLAASDDLHAAELERLEVSAAKVGVRLVAPLGLVLLPAFCLTTVAPLVMALAGDLLSA
jgi:hypothetical protein